MSETMTIAATVGRDGGLFVDVGATPFAPGSRVEILVRPAVASTPAWTGTIPVVDLAEFAGSLVLREDPVEYQKRVRAEWDRDA